MDEMKSTAGHTVLGMQGSNTFSSILHLLCLCAIALGASCSAEVTGPAPSIKPPGADVNPPPVKPAMVCLDQLTAEVVVSGERFSPMPIDIPKDPQTALPNIVLTKNTELDGTPAARSDQILYSGDPDKDPTNAYGKDDHTPLLSWDGQKSMTFVVNQQLTLADGSTGKLDEGIYDISVINPDSKDAESPGALAVVDKPALEKITPSIVCLEEEERSVQLAGSRFVTIGKEKAELAVEGVDEPFALALDGCTKVKHDGIEAEFCETATVSFPSQSVEVGYPAFVVHNPETAACESKEVVNLRVVAKPTIDRAVPVLGCVAEDARTFEIQGRGLLRIDGTYPAVQVGGKNFAVDSMGGCESLETMGQTVETCSSLTISIAKEALEPALYDVMVTNPPPAGCSQTATGALRIVPPPTISSVEPAIVCVDQSDRQVTVHGSDFITIDGVVPAVTIGTTAIAANKITAQNCVDLPTASRSVRSCQELLVTVAQGSLPSRLYNVSVNNPDPAGCSDTGVNILRVVEGPEVTAVAPALVCTDDDLRALVIAGEGFLKIDNVLPAVLIGTAETTVGAIGDCTQIDVGNLKVESCKSLSLTVAKGALSEGRPEVTVLNPAPAGCSTGNATVLTVPPDVTIASVTPSNICSVAGNTQVTIQGTGFLRVDAADFELRIAGAVVTPDSISSCTALAVSGMNVQSCNTVVATVSPSALSAGDIPITITNPAPSGCAAGASSLLRIVLPPVVTGVTPTHACSDVNTSLTITGTGFVTGATVRIGETAATGVTVTSATELTATFNAGLSAATYDVTVENGAGCGNTLTQAITVDPTPIVFFIDPPVVYNKVAIQGTIFTTGLAAAAQKVELVNSSNTATALTFSSPKRVNRIQAAIPGGETLAAGQYEVRVTSNVGCVGFLPGGLTVASTETIGNLTISPAYASPTKPTAVTITVDTGTGADFESIPRVYLNPTASASAAMAVRAVVMVSGTKMTAVIPEGMDSGTYDLIVVNPSGEVGVAEAGVTVTTKEPPLITSVLPESFIKNETDQLVTIRGENFDGVTAVELICDSLTNPVAGTTITTVNATTVTAHLNVDTSGLAEGDVCQVKVVNADSSYFAYSAISVRNNSENLNPWSLSTNLVEARRAPSVLAARPTATSRYLYAIGGDSGVTDAPRSIGTVKSSVESTNIDVFGDVGAWSIQRNGLPQARTWSGVAKIGRFIYLSGGHNGTSATNTLYRSQVLDPLAGPEILDLDAELGDGTVGLGGGLWLYRVAAVFRTSDANNPGGESISGEVLNVQIPNNPKKIKLKLNWAQVTGASGYRIYRSPTANGSIDNMQLLGTVTCGADVACDCGANPDKCQYSDDGQTATTATAPLPAGSLGVWHNLTGSALNTAREAHAAVAAPNYAASGSVQWFLYAIGGRNAAGAYLSSYEYAVVTVSPDGSQTVSTWTQVDGTGVPNALSTTRAEMGAWTLTQKDTPAIGANEVWIYIGPGRSNATTLSRNVDATPFAVGASGDLGEINTLPNNQLPPNHAGYGYGSANAKLFLFGGQGGSATSGGISSPVCVSACTMPTLVGNWNALGPGNNTQVRIYMGSAQESAFFFLVGGHNGTNALNTTEQTVQ